MAYLMIRNAGVADPLGLTLLGASTTRRAGATGTIGIFGSGSKHSVALLLRNGIAPTIYCSNLRMDFNTKTQMIKGESFDQVTVKYSGKDIDGTSRSSTEDLGFTLQWGEADWNNIRMALREFIANAIDGAICAGGSYKGVEMKVVDDFPRAKAGYTTVVIPFIEPFASVFDSVDLLFLHFGPQSRYLSERCIPKQHADGKTRIYKKGVLVSELNQESVYDYNLGDELKLDESRNASDWDVRYAVAKALAKADADTLSTILKEVVSDSALLESGLDSFYLTGGDSEAFKKAWATVAGPKGVATQGNTALDTHIRHKGYNPVAMPAGWQTALASHGVASEATVLSKTEQEGKIVSEPTQAMRDMTDKVWALLEKVNMTNGKDKPKVMGFSSIMDGGSLTMGYFVMGGDTIYLHEDLGGGRLMFATTLEECVHYVTNSSDMSRDLQDALFNIITRLVMDE